MSSGNAVICAILSWHVIEWIYQEFSSLLAKYPGKGEFQKSIKQKCPSLSYMHDIANGSKHRGITRYTPAVRQTESHKGGFSLGFSKGFDVSCLKLELEIGQIVYFDEELDKFEAFIRKYFQSELGVNV